MRESASKEPAMRQSRPLITLALLTLTACGKKNNGGGGDGDGGGASQLTVSINGNGKITSSPSGINCSPHYTEPFPNSTAVTLTAAANDTATFMGWNGACAGTATTCTMTLRADAR